MSTCCLVIFMLRDGVLLCWRSIWEGAPECIVLNGPVGLPCYRDWGFSLSGFAWEQEVGGTTGALDSLQGLR